MQYLEGWSEDPSDFVGVLTNDLRLTTLEAAPDVHFQQSKEAVEVMEIEITQRAVRHSWLLLFGLDVCLDGSARSVNV